MKKTLSPVMLSGSEASRVGHADHSAILDASLPLSMTRERVFFTACHERDETG